MKIFTKVIVTIVIFFACAILLQLIKAAQGNTYSTGGVGPFIIYPAMIAAFYAIWKKKPEEKNDEDKHKLQK